MSQSDRPVRLPPPGVTLADPPTDPHGEHGLEGAQTHSHSPSSEPPRQTMPAQASSDALHNAALQDPALTQAFYPYDSLPQQSAQGHHSDSYGQAQNGYRPLSPAPVAAPNYVGWNPHMAPPPSITPARPGIRLAGALVDGLVLSAYVIAAFVLMPVTLDAFLLTTKSDLTALLTVLAVGSSGYLLLTGYLIAIRGQSVGKIAVGTRILMSNGAACGFLHGFLIRTLGFGILTSIPWLGVILSIANCLFVFSKDHRMLHDRLATTVVATV